MSALSLSAVWNTGWVKTKENYWLILGVLAAILGASVIGEMVLLNEAGGATQFFGWALNQVLSMAVSVAATLAFLQIYRGKSLDISPLWMNPMMIVQYLVASFAMAIVIVLGFIALIIPGFYLLFRFMFVTLVLVDKSLDARSALRASWDLTSGHVGFLFLFFLATIAVNILGVLALGVGLLVSIPVTIMAQMAVYDILVKGSAPKKQLARKK